MSALESLEDSRVAKLRPLLPAACVLEQCAYNDAAAATVLAGRQAVRTLGDKLLVVVGPCSPHDSASTLAYAAKLAELARALSGDLVVLMRCNYAAPDSSEWRGLVMDPELNGSLNINKGLRQMRELLVAVNSLGLPVACEFVDTIVPQYLADLVSWAQVGHGSSQLRVHRQLASGLSMPVGFEVPRHAGASAADAINEAGKAHPFIGVSKQGVAGVVHTAGNKDCHAIVAGDARVGEVCEVLTAAGLPASTVVDCSAEDDQSAAAKRIGELVASGSAAVSGVVLKSFLVSGVQPLTSARTKGPAASSGPAVLGMSVTTPCIDWSETQALLEGLAAAARARRAAPSKAGVPATSAAEGPGGALFRESASQLPTDNLRIRGVQALVPAACLQEELPPIEHVASLVRATRGTVQQLLCGSAPDGRLLVVAGPCCIHDVDATLQYAARLADAAKAFEGELCVLMRCCYAAPDASPWHGAVMDPELNGSLNINKGLAQMRELMQAVNQLGLPVACEFVDTIVPQYLADLVSWSQVGPSKCQSRLYAELSSGLSMPVGFEAAAGASEMAVRAIRLAAQAHPFIGVSKQGVAGVVHTTGNKDCHAIVAGTDALDGVCAQLGAAGLRASAVVDCSAGADAPAAVGRVAELITGGSTAVSGVLLKSFLAEGQQPPPPQDERPDAAKALKHGVSIADACVGWEATHAALEQLAAAVKARRAAAGGGGGAAAGSTPAKKARRSR
ncbi:hypothetical protein T492DRAFT_1079928 [Pavlovales sp. CCMP2436]|nr:hypothetical protein T492DRAFT_1079928 [Pavlovales sp. CCMP2436]